MIDTSPKDLSDDFLGRINFGLCFDKESNTLAINIIQAADLPVMDIGGSSDPYVRVCLLPEKNLVKVTKVHRRNLCPSFNQTVVFPGKLLLSYFVLF